MKAHVQHAVFKEKSESMLFAVNVDNTGEDAHETKLYFDIPEGFEYGGITSTDGKVSECNITRSSSIEE